MPICSRARALPTSHGLGNAKQPDWCRAWKARQNFRAVSIASEPPTVKKYRLATSNVFWKKKPAFHTFSRASSPTVSDAEPTVRLAALAGMSDAVIKEKTARQNIHRAIRDQVDHREDRAQRHLDEPVADPLREPEVAVELDLLRLQRPAQQTAVRSDGGQHRDFDALDQLAQLDDAVAAAGHVIGVMGHRALLG